MLMPLLALITCSGVESTTCKRYFVKPDYDEDNSKNTHTIQYYINNFDKYFTSYTQIWFKSGQYYLYSDVFLNNITNIAFTGQGMNTCGITFVAFASVKVCNSSNVKFENLSFMSEKDQKYHAFKTHSKFKGEEWQYNNYNGSIILFHCVSVVFENIKLMINAKVNGIVVVNARGFQQ